MSGYHRREILSGAMALAASALRAAPDEREIRTAMVGVGHRGTTLLVTFRRKNEGLSLVFS